MSAGANAHLADPHHGVAYRLARHAVDPVVMSISLWRATPGGCLTKIPTQVNGPGHESQSYIFTEF